MERLAANLLANFETGVRYHASGRRSLCRRLSLPVAGGLARLIGSCQVPVNEV